MAHTIFYSWQSDIRAAANRSLIQDALELAIRDIHGAEGETTINPVIDRDTSGVPGSPDIAKTILDKIDNSSVVVADISLVDEGERRRRFPNPNVLIEVGYAIKSLGFSRILLVQNTFNGSVEDLPFDLRGKRIMTYCSRPEEESRTEQKTYLMKQLKGALLAILPVLSDITSQYNDEQSLDIERINREIEDLYRASPVDIEARLAAISDQIGSSIGTPPEIRSQLLNRIVELWRKNSNVSKQYLYDIAQRSISIHPTSGAFFNVGFLAGLIGRPFDSVSAYMKAIEHKDPNPSLCFLNAGNRYREMNDFNIAISFYEKSVQLNPMQANAWLAAAQLYEQLGNPSLAERYYQGFLSWFDSLPDAHKSESRKQQAQNARSYIEAH